MFIKRKPRWQHRHDLHTYLAETSILSPATLILRNFKYTRRLLRLFSVTARHLFSTNTHCSCVNSEIKSFPKNKNNKKGFVVARFQPGIITPRRKVMTVLPRDYRTRRTCVAGADFRYMNIMPLLLSRLISLWFRLLLTFPGRNFTCCF